jgi:hypothetical protein
LVEKATGTARLGRSDVAWQEQVDRSRHSVAAETGADLNRARRARLTQHAWLQMREEVSVRAIMNKQSQEAVLAMADSYRSLSPDDRLIIDELLIEQLASEDETVRFDALALIREFRILAALPALRALADRLETQHEPGAPYEWAKVSRIIGVLGELPERQEQPRIRPRTSS